MLPREVTPRPLGEHDHFSDFPQTAEDRRAGERLAEAIGTLRLKWTRSCPGCGACLDVEPDASSVEQWATVAWALRLHGLTVSELPGGEVKKFPVERTKSGAS